MTLDGKSIAPVMLGKDKAGPRQWIMALGHGAAALDRAGRSPQAGLHRSGRPRQADTSCSSFKGEVAKLVDLKADPEELTNLLDSTDPKVIAARRRLEAVIEACPKQDARPPIRSRHRPSPGTESPTVKAASGPDPSRVKRNGAEPRSRWQTGLRAADCNPLGGALRG